MHTHISLHFRGAPQPGLSCAVLLRVFASPSWLVDPNQMKARPPDPHAGSSRLQGAALKGPRDVWVYSDPSSSQLVWMLRAARLLIYLRRNAPRLAHHPPFCLLPFLCYSRLVISREQALTP